MAKKKIPTKFLYGKGDTLEIRPPGKKEKREDGKKKDGKNPEGKKGSLRSTLIRLAYANPELRSHLLSLLK